MSPDSSDPMSELLVPPGSDDVWITLPSERLLVSKKALASRSAFFGLLADEPGAVTYSEEEFAHVCCSLAPGARQTLPTLLKLVGAADPPDWESHFLSSTEGLLHYFAAAHLLGVTDMLDAAREWAASNERRFSFAVAAVDADVDAVTVRVAVDNGLDRLCASKLIHVAASVDAAAAAQIIIAGGEDNLVEHVDVRDSEGRTALHICAIHDSARVGTMLLDASASLDALCDLPEVEEEDDEMGQVSESQVPRAVLPTTEAETNAPRGLRTPLHLAAIHDSIDVVQLLLERRAFPAACVRGQREALTPLHECATTDASRAARFLAAACATARESIADRWRLVAAQADVAETVGADGAGVAGDNSPERESGSSCQWARFLDPLNAKCGPNGSTALHAAAEHDAPAVVAALLEAGADASVVDDQGDTAVHCAALYGSPRALQELLSRGANAFCKNACGELPLHLMAEFGPGSDEELPLALVARHFSRSFKAQKLLIDAYRSTGRLGDALSHVAESSGTALHAVAKSNHPGAVHAVELLVNARADLEGKDADGRTALDVALRRDKRSKVAVVLRALGAQEPPVAEDPLAAVLGGRVRPLLPMGQATGEPTVSDSLTGSITGVKREVGELLCSQVKREIEEEVSREIKAEVALKLEANMVDVKAESPAGGAGVEAGMTSCDPR